MTAVSMLLALALSVQDPVPPPVAGAPQEAETRGLRRSVLTAADLPQRDYAFAGRATDLLDRSPLSDDLLRQLKTEVETTLATYDIQDRATLRDLHRTLRNLALLGDDQDAAREHIDILRTLQDKEADRLLSGRFYEVYLEALGSGPPGSPPFSDTFRARYADTLAAMPWSVVGVSLKEELAWAERLSMVMSEAWLERQVQPGVDAGRKITSADLSMVADMRLEREILIPLKPDTISVLQAHIEANDITKPDIWAERRAPAPAPGPLTPVTIAIWDSGVDINLFADRLWSARQGSNTGGSETGGIVGEPHGLVFDDQGRPDRGLLLAPPVDVAPRLDRARAAFKGYSDQTSGVRSPEAEALLELTSRLTPEEGEVLLSDISFFGEFAHGTHVAGIAMDNNPAARLMTIRASTDWRAVPQRPTLERAERVARMHQQIVTFLKAGGARVVNISWGFDVATYERLLEVHGVPLDVRRAEAREMFDIESQALRQAIASAPEVLFVVGAGNDNNDAGFAASIPQSIEADNVLTVAAVDQAGEPTGFTATGSAVDIAASGYQVESFVPGGERQQWSGTSMAAPQVVNLVGRLLAIEPNLTVRQIRDCLISSTSAGTSGLRLIHPGNTLQRLQQGQCGRESPDPE